jgi:hypothetical protein
MLPKNDQDDAYPALFQVEIDEANNVSVPSCWWRHLEDSHLLDLLLDRLIAGGHLLYLHIAFDPQQ